MKTSSKFIIPPYGEISDDLVKGFIRQFAEAQRRNHENIHYDIKPKSVAFADGDTTPSVKNGHLVLFSTANTGGTTITDFDEADEGQIIFVKGDANTTIADAGNFKLSAAWNPDADDTITLGHISGVWYEYSRSAN